MLEIASSPLSTDFILQHHNFHNIWCHPAKKIGQQHAKESWRTVREKLQILENWIVSKLEKCLRTIELYILYSSSIKRHVLVWWVRRWHDTSDPPWTLAWTDSHNNPRLDPTSSAPGHHQLTGKINTKLALSTIKIPILKLLLRKKCCSHSFVEETLQAFDKYCADIRLSLCWFCQFGGKLLFNAGSSVMWAPEWKLVESLTKMFQVGGGQINQILWKAECQLH